jgi:hypothetical protein
VLTIALLLLAFVQAPAVVGPRTTSDSTPTYRFISKQRAIHFRCSVDTARLRACASPYTPTLSVGTHLMRVQAVNAAGRRSAITRVTLHILEAAKKEVRVGGRPFSLVEAEGSIWVANFLLGKVERVDPATNRVLARIQVGASPTV